MNSEMSDSADGWTTVMPKRKATNQSVTVAQVGAVDEKTSTEHFCTNDDAKAKQKRVDRLAASQTQDKSKKRT